jgi:dTDP-4-dehydrorhamnose reductase
MKKVVIFAPTGMVGSMVYNTLKNKYRIILVYKNTQHLQVLNKKYSISPFDVKIKFDINSIFTDYLNGFSDSFSSPKMEVLVKKIGKVDAVINCAGVIKPYSMINPNSTVFINGIFPHILSNVYGEKLIHITTDCVFNGEKGAPYDENSPISPNDLYGLSKSIGEPSDKSLVLRTSVIGPELYGFQSLLEWFKGQSGNVFGFTDHKWNGITTKEFALICDTIISNRDNFPKNGLYNLFTNAVSKYEMLCKFKEKYQTSVTITPKKSKKPVDRRLSTIYSLNKKLKIPTFNEMINQL